MPTLEEVAPDLAPYVTEAQAEEIVTATAAGPEPAPKISDLADLGNTKRQLLLLWLKWYRARRIPLEIPALVSLLSGVDNRNLAQRTKWFLRLSPRTVARHLNLDPSFLQSLISQVAAIRAEVARGEDAWMPAAVTPVITGVELDAPSAGDLTITGTDFDSYSTKETRVQVSRPEVGQVTKTQAEIEAAGGSVSATEIVFPASLLPAGGATWGDSVRVRADGLDSATYTLVQPEPVEP
jgi:hypothetical protein